MKTPGRIRNEASYRSGQPDLDVYNRCFEGYVSPRFCGTDLDGLYVASQVVHGVWERAGFFLVHEHKASPTAWKLGQWIALNELGELGRGLCDHAFEVVDRTISLTDEERSALRTALHDDYAHRVMVVVTYGEDPDAPTSFHWLPVSGWKQGIAAAVKREARRFDLSQVDSVPHRRWIRWVTEKGAPQ